MTKGLGDVNELLYKFLEGILANGPLALGWVVATVLGVFLWKMVIFTLDDQARRTSSLADLAVALNKLAERISANVSKKDSGTQSTD